MTLDHPNRLFAREAIHLVILANFAFAQPLFDLIGRHAQILVAWRIDRLGLLCLTIGLALLPGAVLAVVAAGLGRLSRRLRRFFVNVSISLLVALIVMPVLGRAAVLPVVVILLGTLVIGGCGAWLYRRSLSLQTWVTYLTPVLAVFPVLFLLRPGVRAVWLAESDLPWAKPILAADAPPVVLVIFDELPLAALLDENREIDAVRYPAFAELASESHWFRQATTVHSKTRFAVPAMVTGQYPGPSESRVAAASDYPQNLFTWLGESLDIGAMETVTGLCPDRLNRRTLPRIPFVARNVAFLRDLGLIFLHRVLPPRLAAPLPSVDQGWKDFGNVNIGAATLGRAERFRSFVAGMNPDHGFHFLHSLLPHTPWEYFPSGRRYNNGRTVSGWVGEGTGADVWRDDEALTTHAYQRLLLQVGLVDRLLGELIAALRADDRFDRSLLVVAADHGIVVAPGRARRGARGEDPRSELMPVPLFIKEPHQRSGRIDDRNAEIIDIAPTVADALGLALPWPHDGQSLLADDAARPNKRFALPVYMARGEGPKQYPADGHLFDSALERKLTIFGSGRSKPGGLYRFGTFGHLVGQSLATLEAREDTQKWVSWDRAERLASVTTAGDPLLAHIRGTLRTEDKILPRDWVIAINGTIRAVPTSHRLPSGNTTISAIVPEDSFVDGANRVEALWIDETERGMTLRRVGVEGVESYGRHRFERMSETLIRLGPESKPSAWRAFASENLLTGKNLVIESTLDGGSEPSEAPLAWQVASGDPQFSVLSLSLDGYGAVGILIDLEVPKQTALQVFFKTKRHPKFLKRNMRRRWLSRRRNKVYLTFEQGQLIGSLRIHPGKVAGQYRLHALEIRGERQPESATRQRSPVAPPRSP